MDVSARGVEVSMWMCHVGCGCVNVDVAFGGVNLDASMWGVQVPISAVARGGVKVDVSMGCVDVPMCMHVASGCAKVDVSK